MPLTIRSANGEHRFSVAVASTAEQQARGLMFRRALGADEGMLFPFQPAREAAFWMKDTLIPLDMIFIRGDGTIVRIATAQPLDLTPVRSGEPVIGVLEIAGGRAAQLGIKEGDVADWPH